MLSLFVQLRVFFRKILINVYKLLEELYSVRCWVRVFVVVGGMNLGQKFGQQFKDLGEVVGGGGVYIGYQRVVQTRGLYDEVVIGYKVIMFKSRSVIVRKI